MKVMSNKSFLDKNTKTKTNKNYFNLISKDVALLLKSAMLKWTKTKKLVKSGSRRASNFESQSH
jgi:hypothetical protein